MDGFDFGAHRCPRLRRGVETKFLTEAKDFEEMNRNENDVNRCSECPACGGLWKQISTTKGGDFGRFEAVPPTAGKVLTTSEMEGGGSIYPPRK